LPGEFAHAASIEGHSYVAHQHNHSATFMLVKNWARSTLLPNSVPRPTHVGLLFWFGPPSIAPMTLLTRSLALLCSFLLALPGGWCCIVSVSCCHQRRAAEPRVGQAPSLRHNSCCHQPSEQRHNDSTPEPKPSTPVKVCSCEKAPVVPPEISRLGSDLFFATLATPAELPPSYAGDQSDLCRILDPPSPSLQLSHCVWLC
jgi:hypothetical protein